jgi:hypothetical protein
LSNVKLLGFPAFFPADFTENVKLSRNARQQEQQAVSNMNASLSLSISVMASDVTGGIKLE